jgi:hypothetical protein
MPGFNKNYFGLSLLILAIEILIALYVHDTIIRPYMGDVLVVILIYCFLKSFLKISILTTAIAVLIFSFIIEFLQLINIIEILDLGKSAIARIVIGTSFSWLDLLTYIVGIAIVLMVEKYVLKKNLKTSPIL